MFIFAFMNSKIGVIGNGSWATAIVKMLTETQDEIYWWFRSRTSAKYLLENEHNPNYLSSVEFDLEMLKVTTDINEIVSQCDYLILAVPSIYVTNAFKKLTIPLDNKFIFSAIKGIVPEDNMIVGDFLHKKYDVDYKNIGVISGPCHAEEVAMERLSYLTIACKQESQAQFIAQALSSDFIKTKISDDIFGTEYGTVLKNIYAIAAGIAHGLGYGDNFQAILMSNAIREMENIVQQVHPIDRNINNSAYLGDLLVTGYSFFSRNRMLGNMLGKGYTVRSAILEMSMVAEGYYASKGIHKIVKSKNINAPISETVYRILYKEKNPKREFEKLCDVLD
ncbi:glycerol-3-phosphate dehydrogenase (NAD(P)(+)) [Flavobacteriaceae bacterium UJ101]|nr:glycerol-3-phosphate dehydrogenase (NAD(P)(+)) [Flavobacteriaceae bacterium UJ101]